MKRSHQLRALAIVELYGPKDKPTGGRVIPVAILVGDKWYDAGTYNATPRPLALDPGNVYEALRDGEPAGFFTVGAAKQQKGEWYGLGKWESRTQLEAAEKARAATYRDQTRTLGDDGPPRLRKPGSEPSQQPAQKPTPEAPVSSEGNTGKPASPRVEAERVHPVQPEQPLPSADLDPDRPTLRRGGGSQMKQTLDAPPDASTTLRTTPGHVTLIGVSDPDGTGNTRDYRFPWKPEDEKALKAKAIALAESELNKYLAARAPAKVGAKGPKSKAAGGGARATSAAKFSHVEVAAYDLNLDNNAELVVTGVYGTTYVTYIARTDLSFVPQKVFANVTDKEHLDAVPRMELVGPIDAEGRGRAELLFRLVSDAGYRYALYSVSREEAWPIWKSSLYSGE